MPSIKVTTPPTAQYYTVGIHSVKMFCSKVYLILRTCYFSFGYPVEEILCKKYVNNFICLQMLDAEQIEEYVAEIEKEKEEEAEKKKQKK